MVAAVTDWDTMVLSQVIALAIVLAACFVGFGVLGLGGMVRRRRGTRRA